LPRFLKPTSKTSTIISQIAALDDNSNGVVIVRRNDGTIWSYSIKDGEKTQQPTKSLVKTQKTVFFSINHLDKGFGLWYKIDGNTKWNRLWKVTQVTDKPLWIRLTATGVGHAKTASLFDNFYVGCLNFKPQIPKLQNLPI